MSRGAPLRKGRTMSKHQKLAIKSPQSFLAGNPQEALIVRQYMAHVLTEQPLLGGVVHKILGPARCQRKDGKTRDERAAHVFHPD